MSAEAEFTEGGTPKPGVRCKYCARILVPETKQEPAPDEATAHCELLACTWCRECARGQTTVSPAYRPKDVA
jgi:hypothetical protein